MRAYVRLWRTRIGRLSLIMGVAALALLAFSGLANAQVALPEAVTEQGDSIRALYFVVLAIGEASSCATTSFTW